jgi:hypothetical protein
MFFCIPSEAAQDQGEVIAEEDDTMFFCIPSEAAQDQGEVIAEEEAPAGLRLARPGPLVSRANRTQPLHSAVVGEGACSLLLTHHLQAGIP